MKEQKKSKFKKFLIIYAIILTILMLAFLGYVLDSLIKYENNQIDNYIENFIGSLKSKKLSKYIDVSQIEVSEFEKSNTTIDSGFKELINSSDVTYKLNSNSTDEQKPIYDIFIENEKILEVELDGSKKENRLGLLTFNVWNVKQVTSKMENGLYTCNVLVPNNCKVYLNNKQLTESQIADTVQNEGLEQLSKYADIPNIIKYEVKNLLKKPDIKILDAEGKEVDYKQEGNTISKTLDFKTASSEEEAMQSIKGEIDILKIAEDWSLYLTDDLSGRLHGFYNIGQYLIEDSNIEKFAYDWATGIDITFVSSHRLDNPTFTDEKISNFEIYNENAFSCEVYLQKNLILKSGKKIEDKMNERMYFAYYDETNDGKDNPTWKLINMQSITDNKK